MKTLKPSAVQLVLCQIAFNQTGPCSSSSIGKVAAVMHVSILTSGSSAQCSAEAHTDKDVLVAVAMLVEICN